MFVFFLSPHHFCLVKACLTSRRLESLRSLSCAKIKLTLFKTSRSILTICVSCRSYPMCPDDALCSFVVCYIFRDDRAVSNLCAPMPGVSMFAGAGFLLLLIPANGVATSILGRFQSQIMKLKDTRMKLMNEMLAGIKVRKIVLHKKYIPL